MDIINVKGLPEHEVKLVRDFVDFLKRRVGKRTKGKSSFEGACGGWKDLIDEEEFLGNIYAARQEKRRAVSL